MTSKRPKPFEPRIITLLRQVLYLATVDDGDWTKVAKHPDFTFEDWREEINDIVLEWGRTEEVDHLISVLGLKRGRGKPVTRRGLHRRFMMAYHYALSGDLQEVCEKFSVEQRTVERAIEENEGELRYFYGDDFEGYLRKVHGENPVEAIAWPSTLPPIDIDDIK